MEKTYRMGRGSPMHSDAGSVASLGWADLLTCLAQFPLARHWLLGSGLDIPERRAFDNIIVQSKGETSSSQPFTVPDCAFLLHHEIDGLLLGTRWGELLLHSLPKGSRQNMLSRMVIFSRPSLSAFGHLTSTHFDTGHVILMNQRTFHSNRLEVDSFLLESIDHVFASELPFTQHVSVFKAADCGLCSFLNRSRCTCPETMTTMLSYAEPERASPEVAAFGWETWSGYFLDRCERTRRFDQELYYALHMVGANIKLPRAFHPVVRTKTFIRVTAEHCHQRMDVSDIQSLFVRDACLKSFPRQPGGCSLPHKKLETFCLALEPPASLEDISSTPGTKRKRAKSRSNPPSSRRAGGKVFEDMGPLRFKESSKREDRRTVAIDCLPYSKRISTEDTDSIVLSPSAPEPRLPDSRATAVPARLNEERVSGVRTKESSGQSELVGTSTASACAADETHINRQGLSDTRRSTQNWRADARQLNLPPGTDRGVLKIASTKDAPGSATPKPSFPCERCGRTFSRKAHMQDHVRIVHEKKRPFVCEHCGKTFSVLSNLHAHKRSLHSDGVQNVQCEICGKSVASHRTAKHKCYAEPERLNEYNAH
ncbi:Zinc finger protein [Porphyridium purpureum]|uniref:Zinc finger protein n=1 Tax=Porphyridium purpureum TaxID=35688 RepID=A0A5J4YH09_PORPP|nr:Zinc finger protein [Porphyridium purpureum]|eukprot:POR0613..scf251_18